MIWKRILWQVPGFQEYNLFAATNWPEKIQNAAECGQETAGSEACTMRKQVQELMRTKTT